jgi:hypothetical protein
MKMKIKQLRKIFGQQELRFVDVDQFSELLSDVQTCLSVSIRENFSRLPERTDPKYEEIVRDGLLSYLNFLSDRMEGLADELSDLIGDARLNEKFIRSSTER